MYISVFINTRKVEFWAENAGDAANLLAELKQNRVIHWGTLKTGFRLSSESQVEWTNPGLEFLNQLMVSVIAANLQSDMKPIYRRVLA